MKTITETISTYDVRTGTTQRTRIIPLYEYSELNDEARENALDEFMSERANDPYIYQYFNDTYEEDIWACVRELEEAIDCASVEWRYNPWYSADFDCTYKIKDIDWISPDIQEKIENSGFYASMDLCDAWNKHASKLCSYAIAYANLRDEIGKRPYMSWEIGADPDNEPFCTLLEKHADDVHDKWIIELENACEDVKNTIESLLIDEWEYYNSREYARDEFEANETGYECSTRDNSGRVYYSDNRRWYTVDGEFYEQSDANHECVSIIKVA